MRDLCRRADEKYNSGLFHFQKEEGVSEAPDRITPKLAVDDRVIRPILESLYFAHGSPYDFGVMPVEILGTVYERFLGKVIRLTIGHQAKIEEKPEAGQGRRRLLHPRLRRSVHCQSNRRQTGPQQESRPACGRQGKAAVPRPRHGMW